MTTILRQLPIDERDSEVRVPEGWVSIRPYQIIVWASLSLPRLLELGPATPRFPVLLDSGLNHNFAIREDHLVRWAGLRPSSLPASGTIEVAGRQLPLLGVNASWIDPNRPGRMDVLSGRPPVRLDLPRGIAVYPEGVPNTNRLPTLGLRALVVNNLKLIRWAASGGHAEDGATVLMTVRPRVAPLEPRRLNPCPRTRPWS